MATNSKNNPNEPTPASTPRGAMIVLIAGSIAIAALVGWALTREVEPALEPAPAAATSAPASTPPAGSETAATATPGAATTPATPGAAATPAPASAAPQPASNPDPNTGVERLTAEQLKPLVDRGAVTIVDVRDSVSYTNGHIPGAIHIAFSRVEAESRYLPKNKPIVAYCT